jgi:dihydroorotase
MKLLIKQAIIADPASPHNGLTADIFINKGIIEKIGPSLSNQADQIIQCSPNTYVSPGWVDVFAHLGDPGYEYKETLETGAAAAAAGGYTDVLVTPNTSPVVHNKATVEYITQKSKPLLVTIHPIGAITRNTEGKELAEMYDMHVSGAVAFGDGKNCVQSAGLLIKALQYVKAFNGVVIQVPDDKSVNPNGLINEGIASTQMGLPGKPTLAEELIVARDIKLARYAESAIHFTGVSTSKSLAYIKRGKEAANISCSIAPFQLYFCDEDLAGYNTNLKVNPPLRTKEERSALIKAVKEGIVDCIATHHQPHEYDSKVCEFEYAKDGMIGLETAYAVVNSTVEISPDQTACLFSLNARRLFGLPTIIVKEGAKAKLTFFDPHAKWVFSENDIQSKSKNSPFIGKPFTGKVLGIVNEEKYSFQQI